MLTNISPNFPCPLSLLSKINKYRTPLLTNSGFGILAGVAHYYNYSFAFPLVVAMTSQLFTSIVMKFIERIDDKLTFKINYKLIRINQNYPRLGFILFITTAIATKVFFNLSLVFGLLLGINAGLFNSMDYYRILYSRALDTNTQARQLPAAPPIGK